MRFGVRTLRRADRDVDEIYRWLHRRSPMGAVRWLESFFDALCSLEREALSHGIAPEDSRLKLGLRERFFKTPRGRRYRALYVIEGADVIVLRIRAPGQAPVRRRDVN